MKYGQAYNQLLASDEFPTHWVSAALSYRALKKCIKQVRLELDGLGLDAPTLKALEKSFGVHKAADGSVVESRFTPELWVAVDGDTGDFLHAGLTDSTKDYLKRRSLTLDKHLGAVSAEPADVDSTPEQPPIVDLHTPVCTTVIWKQIPLMAATNFFDSLDPALEGLESIQESESERLQSQIALLGNTISTATNPPSDSKSKVVKKSAKDLAVWRQLFELYLEQPIFFSTHERDRGTRTYDQAKSQLEHFSNALVKSKLVSKFQNSASRTAFDNFVAINLDILRIMHFEQVTSVAVRKILKKFDKRTALSASSLYRPAYGNGALARSIARDMCGEISTNIIALVPQLDDYLCPVCCELAWKPVKLGCCNAVFCIRCVIILQRGSDPKCPMCRSDTVAHADASRIDDETIRYLQRYFPAEVRAKQAANERAAGVDRYGPNFYKSGCVLM
ncbi:hypothetical protein ANO11243_011380 [Dothideomycetidae sp. 11243]|nr:hypothetical protein ANO11243_011380 [fungal sp. No.11243]